MKIRWLIVIFIGSFIAMLLGYLIWTVWLKNEGYTPVPTANVPVPAAVYDSTPLPPSTPRSDFYFIFAKALKLNKLPYSFEEAVRRLDEDKAVKKGGDVRWKRLPKIFHGLGYIHTRLWDGESLTDNLKKGKYPILQIKGERDKHRHYVLLVGAEGANFLVYEPSVGILPLQEKVYATWLLYRTTEVKLGI